MWYWIMPQLEKIYVINLTCSANSLIITKFNLLLPVSSTCAEDFAHISC